MAFDALIPMSFLVALVVISCVAVVVHGRIKVSDNELANQMAAMGFEQDVIDGLVVWRKVSELTGSFDPEEEEETAEFDDLPDDTAMLDAALNTNAQLIKEQK